MLPEDSQPNADLGLAFVDVITNGLGAMLVLFFVVVLVQGSLEWSATPDSPTPGDRPDSDPLVLLAQSTNPAFDVDSSERVWRYSGWSDAALADRRGTNWDWGPSHAVLIAPRPPAAGATIEVRTLPGGGELRLELHHGERHWTQTVVLPDAGGWVSVWPWPGATAP
ncbi:MAG: hypothetical protein U0939_25465 [Pirellulales bacterium]